MIVVSLILVGCWVYCVLATIAAVRYRMNSTKPATASAAGISVLRPLSGLDEGLEENLRSCFEQDYAAFELLFAVRHEFDPAVPVVRRLIAQYPHVPARLVITGEPPYPHAKVYSLKCMLDQARYALLAMSDSDVRVGQDFLARIAADFEDPHLGLVTCPYRAVSGASFWSRLEAIGMNTDFHAGVFTAALIEGKKFAVGPTIVARRSVLSEIGGIERVKDYVSEDYMLGRIVAERGFGVAFSSYVIEHRIGSDEMMENFRHRIRWARSTRRSRPWGYLGQFFTYPLPIAALACAFFPHLWPLLAVTAAFRILAAWMVSVRVLGAEIPWHLLLLQDLLAFAFWIAGFFGRSISWRGQRYLLNRDGTMQAAR